MNSLVKFAVNAYLIKIFALKILTQYFTTIGNTQVGALFAALEGFCLLVIIVYTITNSPILESSKDYKRFVFIFIVYIGYIIYYVISNPSLAFNDMAGFGHDMSSFFTPLILITIPIFCIRTIITYADLKFVAKSIIIIASIFFPYYFDYGTILLYASRTHLIMEEGAGYINPLTIDLIAATSVIMLPLLKGSWSDNNLLDSLLSWIFIVINMGTILICSERGPLLFTIITLLLYFYLIGKLTARIAIISSIFIGFLVLILPFFSDILSFFSVLERFTTIAEENGSGRYGDDSIYSSAIDQILSSPIWGSYMRINNPSSFAYGNYAHNFFLEALMTFGIFFTLILLKSIFLAGKKAVYLITQNHSLSIIALMGIYSFLSMQTSLSFYNNHLFWIPLAILSYIEIDGSEDNYILFERD